MYRKCSDQGFLLWGRAGRCTGGIGAALDGALCCCAGQAGVHASCAAVQGKQVYRVRSAQGKAGWLDLSGVQVAAPGCLHQHGQLQQQVLVPMKGLRLEVFWPGENAWFAGDVIAFNPTEVSLAPGS